MKKRLALIGVGKWGANFLRTIAASPLYELTLVVTSKSREELNLIAPTSAIICPDITYINTYSSHIDAFIVATPPQVRAEIIRELLLLNKPILAEKPLTLSGEKSIQLLEMARARKVRLIENLIHLYSWPFLEIKKNIKMNEPMEFRSVGAGLGPFRDYSTLWDYGSHDIAMALSVFQQAPQFCELKLIDYRDKLSFLVDIKLNFGKRGFAEIRIGNIEKTKKRQLTLSQADINWCYDDLAVNKLTNNGIAKTTELTAFNSMQLVIDELTGFRQFYTEEEAWLTSYNVACVLDNLEQQFQSIT